MDAKYGFINGALKEAEFKTGTKKDTYKTTHRIDWVLSHKYFGFPIFFLLLYVMFETTFSLGQYPMDWIEGFVGWLGDKVSTTMPEGPLKAAMKFWSLRCRPCLPWWTPMIRVPGTPCASSKKKKYSGG